ncbi:hypothetical protein [Herminiimonas sp. CN]|uniref:hypothetical protein n=1 Tax=Herminiimonas sp. CN TaxID=1349818 RepID=UPI0004741592|nr:hypothetical protein [Herminiimonas sp. CN]
MKFVLNRNKIIVSLQGHAIEFKKGEPTHVPHALWAEVQAVGALPEDELPEEIRTASKEPLDPIERKGLIFAAFEQLVLDAKRESFTGTGVPHAKALAAQMGFIIDNKERDALWAEFQLADKAE